MAVRENLWPQIVGGKGVPEPVKILREQGTALNESTKGRLYGEITASETPSMGTVGVAYDFYIGVTGKQYRYLLLTVECNPLFDYPVTLKNTIAGTTERVLQQSFKERIRLIFNALPTQDLLRRMLDYASQ